MNFSTFFRTYQETEIELNRFLHQLTQNMSQIATIDRLLPLIMELNMDTTSLEKLKDDLLRETSYIDRKISSLHQKISILQRELGPVSQLTFVIQKLLEDKNWDVQKISEWLDIDLEKLQKFIDNNDLLPREDFIKLCNLLGISQETSLYNHRYLAYLKALEGDAHGKDYTHHLGR